MSIHNQVQTGLILQYASQNNAERLQAQVLSFINSDRNVKRLELASKIEECTAQDFQMVSHCFTDDDWNRIKNMIKPLNETAIDVKKVNTIVGNSASEAINSEVSGPTSLGVTVLPQENEKQQVCPNYLDELQTSECKHLRDHLISMEALSDPVIRGHAIRQTSFSLLSHIIVETRKTIIQKVRNSIPDNYTSIVFLLARTGAGKSTTLRYLSSDKMVLDSYGHYESKSAKKWQIGHSLYSSCTFLPNTEVINGLVVVDFPGFYDTRSKLVHLGMEFALKALIKEYNPKILAFEAISVEDRVPDICLIGARLKRLIDNTQNCFLGITKYFRDFNFRTIKHIEEDQRKAIEDDPFTQEQRILIRLALYTSLIEQCGEIKILVEQKAAAAADLEKIQREKLLYKQQPLPDTEMKAKCRKEIEKSEGFIAGAFGIKPESIIRFSDLEDPNILTSILTKLSQASETVTVNSKLPLDAEDESLLNDRFENDLMKAVESSEDYHSEYKGIETLEQNIINFSLIHTISQRSHPEIGQLLHLPEIDPTIVREYDKKLIRSSIEKYMQAVIDCLNITLIDQALIKIGSVEINEIKIFREKLSELKHYVLGLRRCLSINDDPKELDRKWMNLQCQRNITKFSLAERFRLPAWVTVDLGIPARIPEGIDQLTKSAAKSDAHKRVTTDIIATCSQEIDQMRNTLKTLKRIEEIIEEKYYSH